VAEGLDPWFFITVAYTFGHSLEAAQAARSGRRRQGCSAAYATRFNNRCFISYLLQSAASVAKVVALCQLRRRQWSMPTKHANEFGLTKSGHGHPAVFISDVHQHGA